MANFHQIFVLSLFLTVFQQPAMERGPVGTASVLVLDPSLPMVSLMLDTGKR